MRRSNPCPGPSLDAWIKSPYGCGSGAGSPQPRSHLLGTWHPLCKFRKRNGDKLPIWGRTTKRTQGRRKDTGVDSGTRKGGATSPTRPLQPGPLQGSEQESTIRHDPSAGGAGRPSGYVSPSSSRTSAPLTLPHRPSQYKNSSNKVGPGPFPCTYQTWSRCRA